MRIPRALVLAWITLLLPVQGQTITNSLLNYQPQKFIIPEQWRSVLDTVNWRDSVATDSISDADLEGIVRSQIETFEDRHSSDFPIINEKKIVDFNHDGTYSIALWLNDAVTISFGAVIVKEAHQYSLFYFGRDMSLDDVDGNGRIEIVVRYPIIYKEGFFFGRDPMYSVLWYDIFVLDGTLTKADSRFPRFYRKNLEEYKKAQASIQKFDSKGYAAKHKGTFVDPERFEKMIMDNQSQYIKILSKAILATEFLLKGN